VIPRFADVLTDMGADLPATTRLLLAVSTGIMRYAFVTVPGVAGTLFLLLLWSRRPSARVVVDATLLRLPLVGTIRHEFASGRACYALGGMLRSGLPILGALDAAGQTLADH
jgi:type II secretory pathway component PulF